MPTKHELTQILYDAIHAEHGILVRSNDANRLRGRLYQVRRDLKDPELDPITIAVNPTSPETELMIVKHGKPREKDPQSS